MLELHGSGLAAEFYVICNLTCEEKSAELSDEELHEQPWLLRFCRQEPPFTVAQVKGQGLGLLKDTWESAYEDKEDIQLAVMSELRPEIAESGVFVKGDARHLVSLYPNPPSYPNLPAQTT